MNQLSEIKKNGLVIFAGAGVSSDEHSKVPGWYALNSMVLHALKKRVTSYLGKNTRWLNPVMAGIRQRRDNSKYPPEYQAQIMEEQCGENYFRALAKVDVDQLNSTHLAMVELAKAGYLKAVVTTNFDCLIEKALNNAGIPFEVFIETEDFERLLPHLSGSLQPGTSVPVIKIHGSSRKPVSMIDTLKQRLVGKAALLNSLMKEILGKHFVIYAGFSAADLNHNPDYLGICQSALTSPGAIFIKYPGSKLQEGAEILINAYGSKIEVSESRLRDAFSQLLTELDLVVPEIPQPGLRSTVKIIIEKLNDWAALMQPYEAINTLTALLFAAGEENAAFELRRYTYKNRIPTDSSGEHYARYQYHYAWQCMVSGDILYKDILPVYEIPQIFYRSLQLFPKAKEGIDLWNLYTGETGNIMPDFLRIRQGRPGDDSYKPDGSEMLVFAQAAIINHWNDCFDIIINAANEGRQAGDIPTALKLWTAAARIAALTGDLGQITGLYNHTEYWRSYLGEDLATAEIQLAYAVAQRIRGSATAGYNLGEAIRIFRHFEYWPSLIEALIEGIYFYAAGNQQEDAKKCAEEVNQRINKGYYIYLPHLAIAVTECHIKKS